jgi:hypothetical protein
MFRAYFDHFLRHIIVHICRLFTAYLPKPNHNAHETHIPGHFFNIEHSPYLFPMFSFKKHRSMHVYNHVPKVTKIST